MSQLLCHLNINEEVCTLENLWSSKTLGWIGCLLVIQELCLFRVMYISLFCQGFWYFKRYPHINFPLVYNEPPNTKDIMGDLTKTFLSFKNCSGTWQTGEGAILLGNIYVHYMVCFLSGEK